jgi:hypothetical protein
MSLTTTPDSPATGPESEPDIPPDLDPEIYPIIARHFYGVDLHVVRQLFWDLARLGNRLPAERGVILIEGGR